jgi:hypothetical protein
MYNNLHKITKEDYYMAARSIYRDYTDKDLEEAWLTGVLNDYEPVTGYVFDNEWKRKQARFAESVIASSNKKREIKTAIHLLARQAAQGAITVADAAQREAFDTLEFGKTGKKHSDESQRIAAYHESGHALIHYLLNGNKNLLRVISIGRGNAGGLTFFSPENDKLPGHGFPRHQRRLNLHQRSCLVQDTLFDDGIHGLPSDIFRIDLILPYSDAFRNVLFVFSSYSFAAFHLSFTAFRFSSLFIA